MSMAGCGVPGNMSHHHHSSDLNSSFSPEKPRWSPSRRHLTHSYKSRVTRLFHKMFLRLVLEQAFLQWSQVIEPVNGSKSDLKIGSYHGDGRPFNGPGNVPVHAFVPGRLHFDVDEEWSSDVRVPKKSFDLVGVAIHEIGHLLGLHHGDEDPNAVMYPKFKHGQNKRTLRDDDKALYYSRASFQDV